MTAGDAPPCLTIRVPGVPPSELLPNAQRRLHYHVWGRHARQWREYTACLARESIGSRDAPLFAGTVRVDVVIAWPKGRQRCDFQAAVHALKPHIDGMQDANVFADDKQVVGMTIRQERDRDGAGYTEFRFWPEGER